MGEPSSEWVAGGRCPGCSRGLEAAMRVCPTCGSARSAPADPEHERAALHEWRALVNSAQSTGPAGEAADRHEAFARVLRNGLLPSTTELLLDEATYTLKLRGEGLGHDGILDARLAAILARLELQAFTEPTLTRRIALLRREAAQRERASRREGLIVFLVLLGLLAAVGGGIWLVVRAVSG